MRETASPGAIFFATGTHDVVGLVKYAVKHKRCVGCQCYTDTHAHNHTFMFSASHADGTDLSPVRPHMLVARDHVHLFVLTSSLLFRAVCNGGMNPNGRSLTGEFVLVLPSGCHVDSAKKLAHVEAGSLWRDVDWELSLFGQCIPSPIVQSIGVAGSTLGGGEYGVCVCLHLLCIID